MILWNFYLWVPNISYKWISDSYADGYFAMEAHPDIIIEKKSDSPDEDKSLADSKALIPVLKDFLKKHPLINPKTFLGDAAFDSIEIYKYLLQETSFEKAYIPLRNKLKIEGVDYSVNEEGIPCCPNDPSLLMKREGSKSHLRCGIPAMKFVCPKMKWDKASFFLSKLFYIA